MAVLAAATVGHQGPKIAPSSLWPGAPLSRWQHTQFRADTRGKAGWGLPGSTVMTTSCGKVTRSTDREKSQSSFWTGFSRLKKGLPFRIDVSSPEQATSEAWYAVSLYHGKSCLLHFKAKVTRTSLRGKLLSPRAAAQGPEAGGQV